MEWSRWEIPSTQWSQKVHYRTHNSLPPVPSLSQINPVHVPNPTLWRYILILSSLSKLVNIILINSDEHHKITAEWPVVIRQATWRAQSLYNKGIGVRFVAGIRYFSVPESLRIRPTQPRIHCALWDIFLGIRRPGREADQSQLVPTSVMCGGLPPLRSAICLCGQHGESCKC